MREKIKRAYLEKSEYYIEVIEALTHRDIKFVLLNILVADDCPGDLDIMISPLDYSMCAQILKQCQLEYYTRYQTNQYLWNKYISDIGFIQVHIYCGIWFNNTCYYNSEVVDEALQADYVFNLYVFLIECFYKNKLRDKQYLEYCQYLESCNLQDCFERINVDGSKICGHMLKVYNNDELPTKVVDKNVLYKLRHKVMRVLFNHDKEILFLGVDGAGKSTLIEEVRKVYAKGGIYPQVVYMGLRSSLFSKRKLPSNNQPMDNNVKEDETQTPLKFTITRFVKVCLCWLEYNLRYFLKIRLLKNTSNTVYLIDRCYVDLLMFYENDFVKNLFASFSFQPDKVVMITGKEDVLFNRKKEMTRKRYSWLYSFYLKITELYRVKYGDNMLVVDTTSNDIDTCKRCISNFIAKD